MDSLCPTPSINLAGMINSLLEFSQIQEYEEIASFGGALLMKNRSHKFKIVGGTREERERAEEWAARFLHNRREVWGENYARTNVRRFRTAVVDGVFVQGLQLPVSALSHCASKFPYPLVTRLLLLDLRHGVSRARRVEGVR